MMNEWLTAPFISDLPAEKPMSKSEPLSKLQTGCRRQEACQALVTLIHFGIVGS